MNLTEFLKIIRGINNEEFSNKNIKMNIEFNEGILKNNQKYKLEH